MRFLGSKLRELYNATITNISRTLYRLRGTGSSRIKLVAIAKNEGAYLAEWILHHLYFGFDHIEVHYNGSTDNTVELIPLLKDLPVKFVCANEIFNRDLRSPQVHIYKQALAKAKHENFASVMFLDIDEFWTPVDLTSSIKDVVARIRPFDTISFQWKNKQEQFNEFAPAIEARIQVQDSNQIKSLIKSYVKPTNMTPHNVCDDGLVQRCEAGNAADFTNTPKSRLAIIAEPINAFILHRKERSEREYIAALSRGRPVHNSHNPSVFKNNRVGFESKVDTKDYQFPPSAFNCYQIYMKDNFSSELIEHRLSAQGQVIERYFDVIELIEANKEQEKVLLNKLLKGVKDQRVMNAFQ